MYGAAIVNAGLDFCVFLWLHTSDDSVDRRTGIAATGGSCQYALCIANKCLSMQNCQSISQNGG